MIEKTSRKWWRKQWWDDSDEIDNDEDNNDENDWLYINIKTINIWLYINMRTIDIITLSSQQHYFIHITFSWLFNLITYYLIY